MTIPSLGETCEFTLPGVGLAIKAAVD